MIRDRIKELRRVKASELLPNPNNWRSHPTGQREALSGVLSEIGFAGATIARETADGRLMLIDGHLRQDLADDLIPVLVLDVDEAEADKLLAVFDPIGAMAKPDGPKLAALLDGISFDDAGIGDLLASLGKTAQLSIAAIGGVIEDEIPEPPRDPVTKPGDVWRLGEHRLLCADATDSAAIGSLFGEARAGLLFTSPPYGKKRKYEKEIGDWLGLMQGVFAAALPAMEMDGQVLVNLGTAHVDGEWVDYWTPWVEWMRGEGWRKFGWYVWDQQSGLPGEWAGRLAQSHEFVFHFNREPKLPAKVIPKPAESIRDRTGGAYQRGDAPATHRTTNGASSLATHKIRDSVIRANRQCGRVTTGSHHPAVFSVAFAAAILECWPGLIFDPLVGSGTTIIAAEQLQRRCYAVELSPNYCDIAIERWEKLTGGKAER